MREQHGGDAEAAGGAEHLLGHRRVALFFYLNEIGPPVAQQRPERAAAIVVLSELSGGKDSRPPGVPRDVDRLAEPRIAPALGMATVTSRPRAAKARSFPRCAGWR